MIDQRENIAIELKFTKFVSLRNICENNVSFEIRYGKRYFRVKRKARSCVLSWRMAAARIGRWWIEDGPVDPSADYGYLNRVVDVKDDVLRAVLAERLLVLAAHDGEGVHDVGDGIARPGEMAPELGKLLGCFVLGAAVGAVRGPPVAVFVCRKVQMEEGGVELATEEEAAILVPAERWTVVAAIVRERLKVPRSVVEFEDAIRHPGIDRPRSVPRTCLAGHLRRQHRKLIDQVEVQVDSTNILPNNVVEYEGTQVCVQHTEVQGVLGAEQDGHTVAGTGPGKDDRIHRPLVRGARHAGEPEQPVAIPLSIQSLGASAGRDR